MKIVKHIPNTITSLNLLSGALAFIHALSGNYTTAVLLIFLAAIFDFLDGMAARALKAYSDIGKELDSLADIVSFGLAPSLILYHKLSVIELIHPLIKYIPLIVALFSALRLAKFNIDTRQKEEFLGLPTPACGIIIASLLYFYAVAEQTGWVVKFIDNSYTLPILSIVLSTLLVCEIPMFSMKISGLSWKKNSLRYIYITLVILIAVITLILGYNWSLIILLAFTLYILINISRWIIAR